MFSVRDRNGVRDRVLEMASSDARVIAGAVIGSLALDDGDRWSDLDLTFAVADGVPVVEVLTDWTRTLVEWLGRGPAVRPSKRADDLSGVPAPWVLAVRSLLRASLRIRAVGAEVQAALRECRRKALRSAAIGRSAVRLRGTPRTPRPVLQRAWPLLASRVLDQRRSRLRAEPRLPPT